MKILLLLLTSVLPMLGVSQSTQFDMTTQLKQWSGTAPAHAGVIPIWNPSTNTYIPGDPFVSSNVPSIVQKTNATSTGSVASLAKAYSSNVTANNTLVVVCGVGNGTAPTISDTLSNTWQSAVQIANSTTFNVAIFYAVGTSAGADTVTCNNGGSTASIALEIYEANGFLQPGVTYASQVLSQTSSATSSSAGTSPSVGVLPQAPNEVSFAAFALGTAAQTITVAAPYNNDSGNLNPATPAGLFSMVSSSSLLSSVGTSFPSATATSEPWAVVVATFRMAMYPLQTGSSLYSGFSYHASAIVSSAATATDIASMPGNATNTVLLTGIRITCTQTTAGIINLSILRRSTADSSGTPVTTTIVPDDSNYPAAQSAPKTWTGNPAKGALVGMVDAVKLGCMATGTTSPNDIYISPSWWRTKPQILRGTAQEIEVNLGAPIDGSGTTVTGGSFIITFEFIETKNPTP